jgi:tetratricopeptide (TPR) repeat protein
LIEEVNNYRPADLKSAGDLELLWSEYKATGNREIIERLIRVIRGTTLFKAKNLRDPIKQFLIRIAPHHFEVYEMLRKKSDSSTIGEIASIITRFAFDPATNHLSRGLNLYLEKKYNEAMEEFNKGLNYFPDYCSIYMNIANIYDDQNDIQEAIRIGKKAVSIEPENTGAITNVGRFYYRLKDYDEAIKWYQKALEYDPKKIDCHYGLGITYVSKRDTEKAVIHFKKYLEYAPNGEHVASIKQYLNSIGRTAGEDPENVAVMLQNKRYDVLEKSLLSHLREKKRGKDGVSTLLQAYKKLCDVQEPERAYTAKLAQFKAWLTQYNSSHFANACLGIVYISYAWDARGSGYASTITDQGGRLFRDRLSTAKEYLEKAYSLDRLDPIVAAQLIIVAMGLGLDRKEVERQFQRAILADPTEHEAYFAKLEYIKPKWYGSKEEMFSFAREAVRKAPPNSMIPMVLIVAHWEMYRQSNENASYFRNSNVWKEMKEVFQTVSKSFPDAKTTHNWFARIAYLAGDYEVAREELRKIGDDWRIGVWGNKRTFEEVKRELLQR